MEKETILFICRQNVGRSQMAEGFLRARLGGDSSVEVLSAGFDDIERMKQKYNNHPHPQVIEAMREKNIDISGQTITQLNTSLLERASTIILLAHADELPECAQPFKNKMIFWPIEDPAKGSSEAIPQLNISRLRETRDAIEQIVGRV